MVVSNTIKFKGYSIRYGPPNIFNFTNLITFAVISYRLFLFICFTDFLYWIFLHSILPCQTEKELQTKTIRSDAFENERKQLQSKFLCDDNIEKMYIKVVVLSFNFNVCNNFKRKAKIKSWRESRNQRVRKSEH